MKELMSSAELRAAVNKMTEPARRHRCDECANIFVCHICLIDAWHPLHGENCNVPFLCSECAEKLNIDTVAIIENNQHALTIYDYQTGRIVDKYLHVRGWGTEGRSDGLWKFRDRLYTGSACRFVSFDEHNHWRGTLDPVTGKRRKTA